MDIYLLNNTYGEEKRRRGRGIDRVIILIVRIIHGLIIPLLPYKQAQTRNSASGVLKEGENRRVTFRVWSTIRLP